MPKEKIRSRDSKGRFPAIPMEPGQKFNMLTLVERRHRSGHNWVWACMCECGRLTDAIASNIRSGNTKSCGCHKVNLLDEVKKYSYSKTSLYFVWHNMLRRCYEESNPAYHNYGGRGISVCERWHDFIAFREDMGLPAEGMTLDREDNDLGYSPENCRWATRKEQADNRRVTLTAECGGQTKTLTEWSEITGIKYGTLYGRRKLGWRDDELFIQEKWPRRMT